MGHWEWGLRGEGVGLIGLAEGGVGLSLGCRLFWGQTLGSFNKIFNFKCAAELYSGKFAGNFIVAKYKSRC
jgi:hypothetical protein